MSPEKSTFSNSPVGQAFWTELTSSNLVRASNLKVSPSIIHGELLKIRRSLLEMCSVDGLPEQWSAMDIEQVTDNDNVGLFNGATQSSDTWHNLTAPALSNNSDSLPGKTLDEQRELLREQKKKGGLEVQCWAAPFAYTMSPGRQATSEAYEPPWTSSKDQVKEKPQCLEKRALKRKEPIRTRKRTALKKVKEVAGRQAASKAYEYPWPCSKNGLEKEFQPFEQRALKRKETIRLRKRTALKKAEDVARAKALERALGDLELDATRKEPTDQQTSSPQTLLSFAHVTHILTNDARARKAFADFQDCQGNPQHAGGLSDGDRRRLLLLQKTEESLQSTARESGSVEAALLYQDQRVAYLDELKASRWKMITADESPTTHAGSSRGSDESTALLDSDPSRPIGFSKGTNPQALLRQLPDHLPEKKKLVDIQTARDVEAYHQDPSVSLNKKRHNRVRSALACGRTDLNAFQLEKQRTHAKRVAKKLEGLKELKALAEQHDIYRPRYGNRAQASTEERNLHQPHREPRAQLPTGNHNLYQPQATQTNLHPSHHSSKTFPTEPQIPAYHQTHNSTTPTAHLLPATEPPTSGNVAACGVGGEAASTHRQSSPTHTPQ
ncbi:MAG: hypothetical protein Q9216_004644 [Gyalolechia sp. 2 TL-2023]